MSKEMVYMANMTKKIKPGTFVKSMREVTGFAFMNGLRDCVFKAQGGYYKLNRDGLLERKFRCLNNITFEDLFEILND